VTSFLTPGPNTLSLTSFQNGHDALSLIHLAFDLPAGSVEPVVPEPSPVPEPSSLGLLAMGILCVSGLRRRKSQRRVSVT
jgi:hypothetical protein